MANVVLYEEWRRPYAVAPELQWDQCITRSGETLSLLREITHILEVLEYVCHTVEERIKTVKVWLVLFLVERVLAPRG